MTLLTEKRLNELADKMIEGTITSKEEMEFKMLYSHYREQED